MADRMLRVSVNAFSEEPETVWWLIEGIEPGVSLPRAVFDTAHLAVDPETGATVSTSQPIMGVCLTDFPWKPTSRDRVRVRGKLYSVKDVQPDGVAGITLMLKEA